MDSLQRHYPSATQKTLLGLMQGLMSEHRVDTYDVKPVGTFGAGEAVWKLLSDARVEKTKSLKLDDLAVLNIVEKAGCVCHL